MNVKRVVGWSIFGVVSASVLAVSFVAVNVGGEASTLKDVLDKSVAQHVTIDQVQSKLTGMGYQVKPPTPQLTGEGPQHSLLVYRTWLTVRVTVNEEGKTTGYKMDRDQAWF